VTPAKSPPDPRLAPELTLAALNEALRRAVRPVPSERAWVEVLLDRLPPAWRATVAADVLRLGRTTPEGRHVLPQAEWQARIRLLRAQAEATLLLRDALVLADLGPSPAELAQAPHLEPWLVMEVGGRGPVLLGWLKTPSPLRPDQLGPVLILGLGPREAWARTLHGWVRLSRRKRSVDRKPDGDPAALALARVLGKAETAAALAQQRRRIEQMVADLRVSLEERDKT